MNKRLYRSRDEKMIAGICGGLAEYFNIDPVILRVLFVVLTIGTGIGLITYLIFWIAIPKEPFIVSSDNIPNSQNNVNENKDQEDKEQAADEVKVGQDIRSNNNGKAVIASILILIGVFWLMENIFEFFTFNLWFPIILIAVGLVILLNNRK